MTANDEAFYVRTIARLTRANDELKQALAIASAAALRAHVRAEEDLARIVALLASESDQ